MTEKKSVDPSTPGAMLASLLNEMLLDLRKHFGMFGGISWSVVDVTTEAIFVSIDIGRPGTDPSKTASHVRNAVLGVLDDLIPCPTFEAVVRAPPDRRKPERRALPFYRRDEQTRDLPGPAILIEENIVPVREKWRPRLAEAWKCLTEETRNSK